VLAAFSDLRQHASVIAEATFATAPRHRSNTARPCNFQNADPNDQTVLMAADLNASLGKGAQVARGGHHLATSAVWRRNEH
jgi:capsular polysaccharide biosynthesis protein